jgi:hypothetical protein
MPVAWWRPQTNYDPEIEMSTGAGHRAMLHQRYLSFFESRVMWSWRYKDVADGDLRRARPDDDLRSSAVICGRRLGRRPERAGTRPGIESTKPTVSLRLPRRSCSWKVAMNFVASLASLNSWLQSFRVAAVSACHVRVVRKGLSLIAPCAGRRVLSLRGPLQPINPSMP